MTHFTEAAVLAFPPSCRKLAESAAETLASLVDESYPLRSPIRAIVYGKTVSIPRRIHFAESGSVRPPVPRQPDYCHCLRTRSTDGYMRQASLRHVLKINRPWAVPFVALLAGEYVIEIVQEMAALLSIIQPEIYANFVRENRPLMRYLREKAISYWNCYYRDVYPERRDYPGLVFLHQLEEWAS